MNHPSLQSALHSEYLCQEYTCFLVFSRSHSGRQTGDYHSFECLFVDTHLTNEWKLTVSIEAYVRKPVGEMLAWWVLSSAHQGRSAVGGNLPCCSVQKH